MDRSNRNQSFKVTNMWSGSKLLSKLMSPDRQTSKKPIEEKLDTTSPMSSSRSEKRVPKTIHSLFHKSKPTSKERFEKNLKEKLVSDVSFVGPAPHEKNPPVRRPRRHGGGGDTSDDRKGLHGLSLRPLRRIGVTAPGDNNDIASKESMNLQAVEFRKWVESVVSCNKEQTELASNPNDGASGYGAESITSVSDHEQINRTKKKRKQHKARPIPQVYTTTSTDSTPAASRRAPNERRIVHKRSVLYLSPPRQEAMNSPRQLKPFPLKETLSKDLKAKNNSIPFSDSPYSTPRLPNPLTELPKRVNPLSMNVQPLFSTNRNDTHQDSDKTKSTNPKNSQRSEKPRHLSSDKQTLRTKGKSVKKVKTHDEIDDYITLGIPHASLSLISHKETTKNIVDEKKRETPSVDNKPEPSEAASKKDARMRGVINKMKSIGIAYQDNSEKSDLKNIWEQRMLLKSNDTNRRKDSLNTNEVTDKSSESTQSSPRNVQPEENLSGQIESSPRSEVSKASGAQNILDDNVRTRQQDMINEGIQTDTEEYQIPFKSEFLQRNNLVFGETTRQNLNSPSKMIIRPSSAVSTKSKSSDEITNIKAREEDMIDHLQNNQPTSLLREDKLATERESLPSKAQPHYPVVLEDIIPQESFSYEIVNDIDSAIIVEKEVSISPYPREDIYGQGTKTYIRRGPSNNPIRHEESTATYKIINQTAGLEKDAGITSVADQDSVVIVEASQKLSTTEHADQETKIDIISVSGFDLVESEHKETIPAMASNIIQEEEGDEEHSNEETVKKLGRPKWFKEYGIGSEESEEISEESTKITLSFHEEAVTDDADTRISKLSRASSVTVVKAEKSPSESVAEESACIIHVEEDIKEYYDRDSEGRLMLEVASADIAAAVPVPLVTADRVLPPVQDLKKDITLDATTEYSDYLKRTVGEYLIKGMTQVLMNKPTDPVDFLAHWLHEQRDKEDRALKLAEQRNIINNRKSLTYKKKLRDDLISEAVYFYGDINKEPCQDSMMNTFWAEEMEEEGSFFGGETNNN